MKAQVINKKMSRRACRLLRRVTTVEQRAIIMQALQYSASGYEKKNDTFNTMLVHRVITYLEPALKADEIQEKGLYTRADVMKMLEEVADFVRRDTLKDVKRVMLEMVEERKAAAQKGEGENAATAEHPDACATCENKEDCDAAVVEEK